jgi:hypothetical protein
MQSYEQETKPYCICSNFIKQNLLRIFLFVFLMLFIIAAPSSSQNNSPATSPTPAAKPSLEKQFFTNILKDQYAIWTLPFHLRKSDARWVVPLSAASVTLLATDKQTGVFAILFICTIGYLLTFRWKSVYLEGNSLFVFNYLKQIEIPVTNIASIDASYWWESSPRTITLKLKSPSEFGNEIVFVPKPYGYMATETAYQLRQFLIPKD